MGAFVGVEVVAGVVSEVGAEVTGGLIFMTSLSARILYESLPRCVLNKKQRNQIYIIVYGEVMIEEII